MADCLIEQNPLTNDSHLYNLLNIKILNSSDGNNQFFKQISNKTKSEFSELIISKNKFQKIQSIIHYIRDYSKYILFYFFIFTFFIFFIYINNGRINKRKLMVIDDSKYQIEITKYNILFDINYDSTMNVTENITINYQGIENTGFRRLIPANNGVQIRNIRIGQIIEGSIEKVYHKEYYENGNLVLDIGDYSLKYGKNESYFISYEFRILNKKIEKENMMPLDVIGYEWECKINNAYVQLIVPSGFMEAFCFENNKKFEKFNISETIESKKIISAKFDFLNEFEGVTFYLHFASNSIRSYVDSYPIYYVKLIVVILVIINMMGFIVYHNYNKISPVRYTSALNTMDPLIMSKVINGSVKKRDVTSIIFYWASEGYLDINFDNENDPILIQKVVSIPDSLPLYQAYMFNELFKNGKIVKTSDLKFKFYKTINKVIKMADSHTTRFVNIKSVILSLFLSALGATFSLIAPYNLKKSISDEFDFSTLHFVILLILQGVIWIIRYHMIYHYLINSDYFTLWIFVGFACLFTFCLYIEFIPNFVISYSYKFVLYILSVLCVICSVSIITKTNFFMAKIGEVFGFKQFIEHPVNEEFDSFIKKDPELFYNLLCYAQVLGLNDKWKHKFDNLTACPPHWMKHSDYDRFYHGDCNMINNRIAISRTRMFHNLVVSPHQNKSSGHRSGHSSHSHGSHGFGGGGGHGR